MSARPVTPLLVLAVLVVVMAGCGGESSGGDAGGAASEQAPSTQATREQPAPEEESADGGRACAEIPVPGHEATGVRVQGATCDNAADIVAAAVGKRRQAYEAAGFTCEPSQASGGDTNYVCTQGQARVAFRYGAA